MVVVFARDLRGHGPSIIARTEAALTLQQAAALGEAVWMTAP
jgi:hypothetical protein